MASNSRVSERIRKAKKTASGQNRKRDTAREQRIQSEKKLEAALGEHISLPTVR
jgi:hypothetical protein